MGDEWNWIGKIGLMYASDYIYTYALGISTTCYDGSYHCDEGRHEDGWIYNSNKKDGENSVTIQGTMSHSGYNLGWPYVISSSGAIMDVMFTTAYGVRPTLYLDYDVVYVDGTGNVNDPYQIAIDKSN